MDFRDFEVSFAAVAILFISSVFCSNNFAQNIARHDLSSDTRTQSVISHLLDSIRAKKLDDEWYIKPGTTLRCDSDPKEKHGLSAIFTSIPHLHTGSFKHASGPQTGEGVCPERRLHEAFDQLNTSLDRDKNQQFRLHEGSVADQILWCGQTWLLVTASGMRGRPPASNRETRAGLTNMHKHQPHMNNVEMLLQKGNGSSQIYRLRSQI